MRRTASRPIPSGRIAPGEALGLGMALSGISVVMLGLAVFSMVTASVAAMFVETEERQIERDLMQEIGALRHEVRSLREALQANSSPPAPPSQGSDSAAP